MRSEILLVIIGMALVTYFTRIGSLILFRQTGVPSKLKIWLKYVPTSILTALIVPALLLPKGELDFSIHNHYLVAGIIAAIIAFKTRNIVATLSLGMISMFVLNWLG